jgi:hypothetical protein
MKWSSKLGKPPHTKLENDIRKTRKADAISGLAAGFEHPGSAASVLRLTGITGHVSGDTLAAGFAFG